jgi:hypothetical protein
MRGGVVLTEGWYVPEQPDEYPDRKRYPRWVLAVTETDVYYSRCGEEHHFCKRSTFERWMRRFHVKRSGVSIGARRND